MSINEFFRSAVEAIGRRMSYEEWTEAEPGYCPANKSVLWLCAEEAYALISDARDASNYTFSEYQEDAARTINQEIPLGDIERHALFGMAGEIGELHSLYQKIFQGHTFDELHAEKEVGDLLWFVAEYCSVMGWNMGDVAQLNIDKLRARYPEGFDAGCSLNRKEGDI